MKTSAVERRAARARGAGQSLRAAVTPSSYSKRDQRAPAASRRRVPGRKARPRLDSACTQFTMEARILLPGSVVFRSTAWRQAMRTVLVRYKTKQDQAEANAKLVRTVFDELATRV